MVDQWQSCCCLPLVPSSAIIKIWRFPPTSLRKPPCRCLSRSEPTWRCTYCKAWLLRATRSPTKTSVNRFTSVLGIIDQERFLAQASTKRGPPSSRPSHLVCRIEHPRPYSGDRRDCRRGAMVRLTSSRVGKRILAISRSLSCRDRRESTQICEKRICHTRHWYAVRLCPKIQIRHPFRRRTFRNPHRRRHSCRLQTGVLVEPDKKNLTSLFLAKAFSRTSFPCSKTVKKSNCIHKIPGSTLQTFMV